MTLSLLMALVDVLAIGLRLAAGVGVSIVMAWLLFGGTTHLLVPLARATS